MPAHFIREMMIMQIVIDIDEKEYKRIIEGNWIGEEMAEIFANGTVLPPKHGRLIDADALEADIFQLDWRTGEEYAVGFSEQAIDKAPTIIPADKEGER